MIEVKNKKASCPLVHEVHTSIQHGEALKLVLSQLGTTSELRRIEAERKLVKVVLVDES